MGLIDKFLESFFSWAHREVISMNDEEDAIRDASDKAEEHLAIAIELLDEAKDNNDDSDFSKTEIRTAQDAKNNAADEKTKAFDAYKEMLKKHVRNPDSFHNNVESSCRKLTIVRECYHGGKYNGVNCIKIMNSSDKLLASASEALLELRSDNISEEEVIRKCNEYSNLLNGLDSIWSHVCSIETGLLPTEAHISKLESLLTTGKNQWLALGISTSQPKWHLTFDGILLRQVKLYQGLADKGDSPIELGHQIFRRLQERFRRGATFQQRERFIMRAYRQRSHPKCLLALQHMDAMRPHHGVNSPRKLKRMMELAQREGAKRIKRETVVGGEEEEYNGK